MWFSKSRLWQRSGFGYIWSLIDKTWADIYNDPFISGLGTTNDPPVFSMFEDQVPFPNMGRHMQCLITNRLDTTNILMFEDQVPYPNMGRHMQCLIINRLDTTNILMFEDRVPCPNSSHGLTNAMTQLPTALIPHTFSCLRTNFFTLIKAWWT